MSEDRQESSTEHTVSNDHDIEENTRTNSEQNFLSVLTAMQASMSQTNEYLKCIFEGCHTIERRPHASDAGYVDEAENSERPAPKRAKSAPKSGHTSEGNDPSILNQQNAVVVDDIEQSDQPHVVVDDTEQSDQPHVADDTLSLFRAYK